MLGQKLQIAILSGAIVAVSSLTAAVDAATSAVGPGLVVGPQARQVFEKLRQGGLVAFTDFENIATGTHSEIRLSGPTGEVLVRLRTTEFRYPLPAKRAGAGAPVVVLPYSFVSSPPNHRLMGVSQRRVPDGQSKFEMSFAQPVRLVGVVRNWNTDSVTRFFDRQGRLLAEHRNGTNRQFVGYVAGGPETLVQRVEFDGVATKPTSGSNKLYQVGEVDDLYVGINPVEQRDVAAKPPTTSFTDASRSAPAIDGPAPWRDPEVQRCTRQYLQQVVFPNASRAAPGMFTRIDDWGRLLGPNIQATGPVDGPWENPSHFVWSQFDTATATARYGISLRDYVAGCLDGRPASRAPDVTSVPATPPGDGTTVDRRDISPGPGTSSPASRNPPAKSVCAVFVRADRRGPLAQRADVSGNPHTLRHNYVFTGRGGWQGDVIMRWSRPPIRVCSGKSFRFEIEVRNLIPDSRQDPAFPVANIAFGPVGGVDMGTECSNPSPSDPVSRVVVRRSEGGGSNSCKSVINVVGGGATSKGGPLFVASLNAGPSDRGTGTIYYIYKREE